MASHHAFSRAVNEVANHIVVASVSASDTSANSHGRVDVKKVRPMAIADHSSLVTDHIFFPGPHKARPGLASVCSPSLITWTPLTKTCLIPVAYWCGLSKVA